MKLYHQLGFRYKWNIQSYKKGNGDGFIFSPINIDSEELKSIDSEIKQKGLFDPQIYFPKDSKSKLQTYDYFPNNLNQNFQTTDFESLNIELAKKCVDYQQECGFGYYVIPVRYYESLPSDFYDRISRFFIDPYLRVINSINNNNKKILLTVIVKQETLIDEEKRDFFLNWVTGIDEIDGVYLIFENNFASKQVKDIDYLYNSMFLIHSLKQNELEVHIGYCNTEGILLSLADPDSITMGSYENLRSFKSSRFQTSEGGAMRGPNARIYSAKLLQWIDYNYLAAMKNMIPEYQNFFEESEYKPLMFKPSFKWHFQKAEPYKHFFTIFSKQVKSLPENIEDRIGHVEKLITLAIKGHNQIAENGVLLDTNSDGSHLAPWLNVLAMYKKLVNL